MARKQFRAVPLRAGHSRPRWRRGTWDFAPFMVAVPLAAFTGVFFYEGPPPSAAGELPEPSGIESGETTRFTACSGRARVNCVVDGDTFWFAGEKVRIADINTPEVSSPECPREAALGARASERLLALLNQGAFTLESPSDFGDRDRDSYGRLLRTVTRGGESVGAVLVREGLAEEWRGTRGGWC